MIDWPGRLGARLRVMRDFALGRSRIETIHEGVAAGSRFCAGVSNPAYGSGSNELPVQEALAGILHCGDTFYDVGANVGFFSVIGARLVGPAGTVVAFEPVPLNLAYLRLNCRINDFRHVKVVATAVSDRSGESTLMLARFSGGASLAVAGRPPDFLREVRVATITLDDWLAGQGAPAPDVVKIDVEGAELQVLQGMQATLRAHRPRILLEVDGPDEQVLAGRRDSCLAFLAAHDYDCAALAPSYPDTRWLVHHVLATPRN